MARLLNIISPAGLRQILHTHGWGAAPLDDDDDEDYGFFGFRKRREGRGSDEIPKVPSDAGTELMESGDFGNNPHYVDVLKERKEALATRLMWRELGIDVSGAKRRPQSISQVSARLEFWSLY